MVLLLLNYRDIFFKKLIKVKETDEYNFRRFNKPKYEIWTPVLYFDNDTGLNNAINNWVVIWYKWFIKKTSKSFVWNMQEISFTYTIITMSWWWSSILYANDIAEQNIYSYNDLDLSNNEQQEENENN